MEKLLELKNVKVKYDTAEALKGISMYVAEKTVTTLIGANGAGKTTTLRAISGLVDLSKGEVWFEGQRLDTMEPHDRVAMGIAHCPEGRRVFPYMTVLDNLRIGTYSRRGKGGAKEDLEFILSIFPRLRERVRQRAGSLSGGEQQMVAIGRALMLAPKIILLDEPTMGLSPLLAREVLGIIGKINRERGVSTLLIEQNAQMALDLAEFGYVLETGIIVQADKAVNLAKSEEVKKAYLGG